MSQTYIAVYVMLLANILPHLGIQVGPEALTTAVSVGITIVSGLWIAYRRYQAGGVSMVGRRC